MATDTPQPDAESLAENPVAQSRDWFALGVRPAAVLARLQQAYGLDESEAEATFQEMMGELEYDFATAADRAEEQAADFYREIKCDPRTPWGARLKAQVDLERLLQLVARSAEPGGRRDPDVLEAFAFHEKLVAVEGPTPNQKLRSNARRLLLLGVSPLPERRGSPDSSPRPRPIAPARPAPAPSDHNRLRSPPATKRPSDDELRAFAREQLVRELTNNDAEYQAVCKLLADSAPERAAALLESLRTRRAGLQPPPRWPPVPTAQPPP